MRIVNFVEVAKSYTLAPEEAIRFYEQKGLKTTFAWQDMIGAEHDHAFTVAKMMNADLLSTIQQKMNSAIANGETFKQFAEDLIPQLQKAGWWGSQALIDPKTGQEVIAQLGSVSRLNNIFRTNMQTAYSVGEWQRIKEQAERLPYLFYDAVDDDRTRPEHRAHDGKVYPIDHAFWRVWYPPNGWQCRCGTIQMDAADLAEYGLEPSDAWELETRKWTNPRTGETIDVPKGIDPGWDYNPGQGRAGQIQNLVYEKYEAAAKAIQTPTSSQQSLQQASQRLKERYPNLEIDMQATGKEHSEKLTIAINKLNELSEEWDTAYGDEGFKSLTYGTIGPDGRFKEAGVRGSVHNNPYRETKQLFLNSQKSSYDGRYQSRLWHPQTGAIPEIERTTVHEFGHLISQPDSELMSKILHQTDSFRESELYQRYTEMAEDYLAARPRIAARQANNIFDITAGKRLSKEHLNDLIAEWTDDAMEIWLERHPDGNLFVSEYAIMGKNPFHELLAESFLFAQYNDPESHPIVAAIMKIYSEAYKR